MNERSPSEGSAAPGAGASMGDRAGVGDRTWNRITLAAAVVLSAVLALAAYAKFTHPSKTKRLFESADGVDYLMLQDHLIAALEVVVIAALLLGHRLKLAWVGVSLMFGGFAGYALFYLLRGESCGCFGGLFTPPIWMTFVIDIVAVGVALVLLGKRGVKTPGLVFTFAGALMLSVAGYGFARATAPMTAEQIEQQLEEEAAERATQDAEPAASDGAETGGGEEGDKPMSGGDGPASGGGVEPTPEPAAELPGRADGFTAMERLLRSDLLDEARSESVGELAPAYYVFVYDPDCPVCLDKLVWVEQYALTYAPDDPIMRTVTLRKREIEQQTRGASGGTPRTIEFSAWAGSPVVFLVQQGRVTHVSTDDGAMLPEELRFEIESGMFEANFPGE